MEKSIFKQEQIAREKMVTGRIQLQVWYHSERTELVVSLMAADDLAPRDDSLGFGGLPEAYAKVRIQPKTFVPHSLCAYLFLAHFDCNGFPLHMCPAVVTVTCPKQKCQRRAKIPFGMPRLRSPTFYRTI